MGFLKPSSSSMLLTRPIVSGPSIWGNCSGSPSTSRPTRTKPASSSAGLTDQPSLARCRISVSQDCAIRTVGSFVFWGGGGCGVSGADAERQGEADVALHHVAHVGQTVAELQGALQAHAER